MINEKFSTSARSNKVVDIHADLVVVGGGMAGICTAITAARAGIKVTLVQDRPVLGGNASSEIRLWILGATSHMGNNNRWSREGGVIDEILVENLFRNKESNTLIFDSILLEKVTAEPNITLLLNTAAHSLDKASGNRINAVEAFCSQNSTSYRLSGELFCDASGDGIIAFQAGAEFRMGAESSDEFGEKLAPKKASKDLLGHSMYFNSKRHDQPVKYVPPAFASDEIGRLPRCKILNSKDHGCRLWWIEYGGTRDTVHETEEIKWELWRVIYGIWDHIKNSGEFEDVDNLTLEWVGTIPGKRESRRFVGEYLLKQQDLVEQREFTDAVAFGGWAIDHHPPEGVYSDAPACAQYHCKGIYQIPYRCYFSKDIDNLFFAGRIISATHIAFGSSRVMATSAHGGQAVGMAAAMCIEAGVAPVDLLNGHIKELQNRLNFLGQGIPGVPLDKSQDLIGSASISASTELELTEIPDDGIWLSLATATAQVLPLKAHTPYRFQVRMRVLAPTSMRCELRVSDKAKNYTPNQIIEQIDFDLEKGEQLVDLVFSKQLAATQYGFLTFLSNASVEIACSKTRISGLTSVYHQQNKAVSNLGKQIISGDFGLDEFEFWTPRRDPAGQLIAMMIEPPLDCFAVTNLRNGVTRPGYTANAWVAALNDKTPRVTFSWPEPKSIGAVVLHLDTDFDHAMESSLMGHPQDRIPLCISDYKIMNDRGEMLHEVRGNYQTVNRIKFSPPEKTSKLVIEVKGTGTQVPAAIFEVCCLEVTN